LDLLSINLSGHSLGDSQLMGHIIERFKEGCIPPEKICMEITETAAITNLTSATRFIKMLKEWGCRFALDDFGSGLSSFAYLKNLPVDFLKIDGLFVKDILDDAIDYAMVKSINEIGHVMGKETVAEFVDSKAVLNALADIGVDYAQGYAVGKPQPIETIV
jgi:EAL domain-containing protein (putative c-di-GMP-specific phosphodiesterase class I)